MAASGDEGSSDFYAVLGLQKECTESELRTAYKKLAMRWHPDRCSASGNLKFIEDAKKKFQAIQEAYTVLSDSNKRFLYDVGVYDSNDDDENGMSDFLSEMAEMMNQTKPNENEGESFEELQELFNEMFQTDMEAVCSASSQPSCSSSSSSCGENFISGNKRNSSGMNLSRNKVQNEYTAFHSTFKSFCFGTGCTKRRSEEGKRRGNKRRN